MTGIDSISALGADDLVAAPSPLRRFTGEAATETSFGDMLMQGLEQVNADLLRVQAEVREAAVGEGADLHRVMVSMEESRLAFQVLLQVRSKLLEAYQDIIRMQV